MRSNRLLSLSNRFLSSTFKKSKMLIFRRSYNTFLLKLYFFKKILIAVRIKEYMENLVRENQNVYLRRKNDISKAGSQGNGTVSYVLMY